VTKQGAGLEAETKLPDQATHATPGEEPSGIKLLIEFAPLIIFFATYRFLDIYWATGVLILASIGALLASRFVLGKVTPMLWVTTVIVVGFGLLTLWMQDPRFIKMKPTIVNLLFAAVLGGGLLVKRNLIKPLMEQGFKLTDEGWRQFTIRFVIFFLAMAVMNEIVWRNFSESTWVNFKTFALPLLAIVFFAVAQLPVINRYAQNMPEQEKK
jgi:intracellular septation protein